MTILIYIVGACLFAWSLPKILRHFFGRKEGPEGKRIGWKIDKKKGKAYGLYLVAGKVKERGEEDVILDTAS